MDKNIKDDISELPGVAGVEIEEYRGYIEEIIIMFSNGKTLRISGVYESVHEEAYVIVDISSAIVRGRSK